jgi:hypothetical protein
VKPHLFGEKDTKKINFGELITIGEELDDPAVSALSVLSIIGWVTKINYLELLASEGNVPLVAGCISSRKYPLQFQQVLPLQSNKCRIYITT